MGVRLEAEAIGLMALGFLAGRDEDLSRFLGLTGLTAGTLRAAASKPGTARAALGYVMGHEATARDFALEAGLSATDLAKALAELEGGWDRGAA